jgi:hypothetical protein
MRQSKSTPSARARLKDRWQRLLEAERQHRARTEAELRAWQDRFWLFLDHAPLPAFIRDEQGRHIYGNKPWAAQFDRPLNELLGKTNWELFPKETAVVFEASDHAALAKGTVSGLLESGLAPDGRRHWWKVFKFPLPVPGGATWIGGLALDVSDLMFATARLGAISMNCGSCRLGSGRCWNCWRQAGTSKRWLAALESATRPPSLIVRSCCSALASAAWWKQPVST